MKIIKSQNYGDTIKQKTRCPKCNKEQGFKNVTNPSHPSIYTCDCGKQFNPDNEKPKAPMAPRMAQQQFDTISKLRQIKQLLDEIGGEMQATTDEVAKEEISNWVMELRRTLDHMI